MNVSTNTVVGRVLGPNVTEHRNDRKMKSRTSLLPGVLTALLAVVVAGPETSAARAANNVPISHAGDDATVEGGVLVTLDGTHSWDSDNDPLTYSWTQTEDPLIQVPGAEESGSRPPIQLTALRSTPPVGPSVATWSSTTTETEMCFTLRPSRRLPSWTTPRLTPADR
jgi:hypothetical protein